MSGPDRKRTLIRVTKTAARPATLLPILGAIAISSCDSIQIGPRNEPRSARFVEQGSACEVDVRFSDTVYEDERVDPAYYVHPNGKPALSVQRMEDLHVTRVSFAAPLAAGDTISMGGDVAGPWEVEVVANPADATPPQIVDVRFPTDPASAAVVLTFDDALDPNSATDPANYAIAGTIDHPVRATLGDCGRTVTVEFEQLSGAAALDVDGLTDVNGVLMAPRAGAPVLRADEETRPEVVASRFAADGPSATVIVEFSEAVDGLTATSTANYTLQPGGDRPLAVTALKAGRAVALTFTAIDPPVTLDVSGVTDLNNNPMLALTAAPVDPAADITPPTVVAASFGGRDESGNVSVRVTFSEALTQSSATQTLSFALTSVESLSTATAVTAEAMAGGSQVELAFAFVPPGATLTVAGVVDLNGNASPILTGIPIETVSDRVPPRVVAASFAANALQPTLYVTFDKALDEATATALNAYALSGGTEVLSAALQADGRTVRLITQAIDREETLAVANVSDQAGNAVTPVAALAIVSEEDADAPQVDGRVFADNGAAPSIEVTFSEVVDKSSAQTAANYFDVIGNVAATSAMLHSDGRTAIVRFAALSTDAQLRVSGVTDLAGHAVEASTGPVERGDDDAPPAIESARYVANATQPTVDVSFTEAVDRTLAESEGLYLVGDDRVAPATATLQSNGRTVRLVFPPLRYGDTLDVRAITDLNGNQLVPVADRLITAASDADRPFVIAASFAANAASPTVLVTFNEAVDKTSAEATENYETVTGDDRPTTALVQSDTRTVELVFPPMSRSDTLSIRNVSDFASNRVDSQTPVVIARDPEVTRPTVVSATVVSSTQIRVVFSEAVDAASAASPDNYTGYPGSVATDFAVPQSDGRTVLITVKSGTVAAGNQFDVANVTDMSGNVMAPATDVVLE